ncbi:hypothetical protein V6N13_125420 [Hibiscus sabdariffa]|uniref:Phytocyanin domain-containing protein n=1 Tax=Hibiscus sabdariffa TaxID=183260 RepID=A0ABR2U5J9_9ROSI
MKFKRSKSTFNALHHSILMQPIPNKSLTTIMERQRPAKQHMLSPMAELILLCFRSFSCFALTSHAATYAVGDISTDIDSWATEKRFYVGDVLCKCFHRSLD